MPLSRHRPFVDVLRLCAVVTCVIGLPTVRAGSPQAIDPMETVRERLAAKLGAVPVTPSAPAGVLKVSTPAESASAAAFADRPASRGGVGSGRAVTKPGSSAVGRPTGVPTPPSAAWAYDGAHGPDHWAQLAPENAACGSGQRQSPIDITGGIQVDLDAVQFDYRPSGFRVVDNGHTVQVNVASGNSIEVLGRHYELVQFHFHRPSEERIDGKPFDMVVHLLHKSADGKFAMIAVLLEQGSAQPVVQAVWNNLPLEKGDEVVAKGPIDISALLPSDRRYYTYMGSLTTPPCSEGVLWMVMKVPVQISPEQLAIFTRLYPMNARPIQAPHGRLIKESN